MRFLLALLCLLVWTPAAAEEATPTGELIRAHERVVDSTREYRASLERLLPFQETDANRAAAVVQTRRELFERGIVSRRELEDSERQWQAAIARLDETRKRMGEADALIGETLAAIELAKIPKAHAATYVSTPAVIQYRGAAELASLGIEDIERFFVTQFGRSLPVSARGQTPVHDRLGFDHRHAVDVAVQPDSDEGQALMEYLRQRHIPFLAFRRAIPGSSTGAHVHIGRPSLPLAAVSTTGH